MTTPLPSPTPFAELLKQATPDPKTPRCFSDAAREELICRLLAWAHAGGVDDMERAYLVIRSDANLHPYMASLAKRLRASLALLDGKK